MLRVIIAAGLLAGEALAVAFPATAVAADAIVADADSAAADTAGTALVSTTWNGQNYGCKCYLGESCWPSANAWQKLNASVDGQLLVHIPPGAPCHNTFDGPLGTLNTYDAAACTDANANFNKETWQ